LAPSHFKSFASRSQGAIGSLRDLVMTSAQTASHGSSSFDYGTVSIGQAH
jgi:hypothetical protein